jgi:2'-5' RNA ligase
MNGLPAEMIDRWQDRAEPAPGEGLIYWHILLGDNPDVVALAREAQQRLAPFSGLHMTPLTWLHMTVLIAGPASEIGDGQIQQLARVAGQLLADVPPPTVAVGNVLYHPEAIMLAARPSEALLPVLEVAQQATREVTGSSGRPGSKLPWTPHITIAYSTAHQPTGPIIDALGRSLPERKVQIRALSLVNQRGSERDWDWQPRVTVPFEASPGPAPCARRT